MKGKQLLNGNLMRAIDGHYKTSNTISSEPREKFIDLLKGFGIFLVVWGHTMNPRSIYIYSFHMPLFFFLSGYVHKDKLFREFFISRINRLYIPYVIFSLVSWLYYLIRHIWFERYSMIENHITKLSSIITGTADNGGNNPIWYLPCIFLVSITFFGITHKVKKPWIVHLIILGLSLAGYLLHIFKIKLFFYADVGFTGIVFYYLGYLLKQRSYLRLINRFDKKLLYLGVLILGILHIITAYLNTYIASISRVNMAGNLLGNYFLFYLAAFFGIAVFFVISYKIQYIQVLNVIGMNTLIILAVHKPFQQILNGIFQQYFDTASLVYGFVTSTIVIIISVVLSRFLNRKIPFALGKKPLMKF